MNPNLKRRLTMLINEHGSMRAAASAMKIDPSYFYRLFKGEKKQPSESALKKLGLVQVIDYAPAATVNGWMPVGVKLPRVSERFDAPLEVAGEEIRPLNRSIYVLGWDGEKARGMHLEWFDGCLPLNGITHWKPVGVGPGGGN